MKRKRIKINYGNLCLLLIIIFALTFISYYTYKIISNDETKTEEKTEKKEESKLSKLGFNKNEIKKIETNMKKEEIEKIDKYNKNLAEYSEVKYFHLENIERYDNLKEKNDYSTEEIIMRVNTRIDKPFYTDITTVENPDDPFVLVNKYYSLDKDYTPSDLINVGGNQRMKKEAGEALIKMIEDVKNNGMYLQAQSGYRDYDLQTRLYNGYVSSHGQEEADTFSARPGSSEHQTGLAIDVSKDGYLSKEFENTNEFKWLNENAHKYGFILRYPKDKIYITGYDYEPWHYRYVGIEVATLIKNENITYEEYCVKYLGTY